jgi:UDP-4-amino-4,6-dideoxy-N-acetyl-beta-L-altrosamine N-acetyltransferase
MVTLVDIQKELHAELLHRWRQQPDVARFMFSQKPISWTDHLRWLETLEHDPSRKHWIITFNRLPVGSAYLTEIDASHSRTMSGLYLAHAEVRGHGVGAAAENLMLTYAFNYLGLEKVSCEIANTNESSLRMHKQVGFLPEGVFRRHVKLNGAWTDVHRLAILRDDWIQKSPTQKRIHSLSQ